MIDEQERELKKFKMDATVKKMSKEEFNQKVVECKVISRGKSREQMHEEVMEILLRRQTAYRGQTPSEARTATETDNVKIHIESGDQKTTVVEFFD